MSAPSSGQRQGRCPLLWLDVGEGEGHPALTGFHLGIVDATVFGDDEIRRLGEIGDLAATIAPP